MDNKWLLHEVNEAILCIENREQPNIQMCLDRLYRLRTLIEKLETLIVYERRDRS